MFKPIKLSPEQYQASQKLLTDKTGANNCPMCSHPKFSIVDYITRIPFGTNETGDLAIGALVTICENCGFVGHFGLNALGLDYDKAWREATAQEGSEE